MATENDDGVPQAEPPKSYDRRGGDGPAYRPSIKGPTIAKIDANNWKIVDQPGVFKTLSKSVLNIDTDYQRTNINNSRINRIAGKWSWLKFGVISVAQRPDGTYYVYDGQHRKLAADKRADVDMVPCIVFKMASQSEESKAFLAMNADRGSVKIIDKFRSLLAGKDDCAIAVEEMVKEDGYEIATSPSSNDPTYVRCLAALMEAMSRNKTHCKNAWTVSTLICGKEHCITDKIFKSLFTAENHLKRTGFGSITDDRNIERLVEGGYKVIVLNIDECRVFFGQRPNTGAEAIVRILNKGRRNRIPSALASTEE